jgi:hypothetical protein
MHRFVRRRPSPATVIACIALAVALGGTSYAAVSLPRNSVGTAQLKNNAVTTAKVKNHSLLRVDFRAGQVPAGRVGPPGPAGPAGPTGATGPTGTSGASASTLSAVLAANGSLSRSSGVQTTSKLGTGKYNVRFNKNVTNCVWHATIGSPATGTVTGMASTELANGTNDTIAVTTLSAAGAAADRPFHLSVLC